jgi:hypothetical protein
MPIESDDSEPTRAELERIAFGRAESAAEIAAAQDALRRLVEADAAAAPTAAPADVPAVAPDPAARENLDEDPLPRPRRRTLVPLLVVVGLFACAVVGVLVTHPASTSSIGAAASGTPTPLATANAAAALKSLLVSQTRADKEYPLPEGSGANPIQPASVHRILTAPDGTTLWTGRSETDICLMSTRHLSSNGSIGGTITCATPGEFARSGLSLSDGANSWTWNGIQFTTTLGQ